MWRRVFRFVDWRFFIALALLVGVGAAVQGSLAAGQERDRAIQGWAEDREVWDAERHRASNERRRMLQGQKELADKYDRLIAWLNDQHIVVPPQVLEGRTTVRVERDNNDNDDSDDSDDSGDRRRDTVRSPTTNPPPPSTGGGGVPNDGDPKSGNPGRHRTDTRGTKGRTAGPRNTR